MNTPNLTKRSIGMAAGLLLATVLVGACSSAATAGPTQFVGGATQAAGATPVAAGGTGTVMAETLGSQTILAAGSNGMTVYTFTSDTVGSGKSARSEEYTSELQSRQN